MSYSSDQISMTEDIVEEIFQPTRASVEPHQLCRSCTGFKDFAITTLPHLGRGDNRNFEHYNRMEDLLMGAQSGCHLCTLIVAQLDKTHPVWLRRTTQSSNDKTSMQKAILSTEICPRAVGDVLYRLRVSTSQANSKERPEATSERSLLHVEVTLLIKEKHLSSRHDYPSWARDAQLSCHIGSVQQYDMVREWLRICNEEHSESACTSNEQFTKPTRLLELTLSEAGHVRLVDGASTNEPYAALSYSWGTVAQVTLIPPDMETFKRAIPIKSLSSVLQDAIEVCHNLSVRYLWIDALCIVQGPNGDFHSETARMRDVYAGAELTIVAASSRDTTESFLRRRNPLQWINCRLSAVDETFKSTYYVEARKFGGPNNGFEDSRAMPDYYHIDTRAWYLQERFMSRRSILFGQRGIHWECRSGVACEYFPSTNTTATDHYVPELSSRCIKEAYTELQWRPRGRTSSHIAKTRALWGEVLQLYTQMNLTFESDRLVAIAGIASSFRNTFDVGKCATYGLWVDYLPEQLLWLTEHQNPCLSRSIRAAVAPSWSWAALQGRKVDMRLTTSHDCRTVYSASILTWPFNADFDTPLRQHLSDAVGGTLCIESYLVPCTVRSEDGSCCLIPFSDGIQSTWNGREIRNEYYKDTDAEERDLYCLLLISRAALYDDHCINFGLVLTSVKASVEGVERCYRRTGIFEESLASDAGCKALGQAPRRI